MLALAVHYGAAARPPCQVASQAAPPGWGRSWAGLSRRAVSQVQRPGMNWSGDVLEPGLHPGQGLLGPHPAPGGGAGPMHCMTAGKAINVNTCHTHWALTSPPHQHNTSQTEFSEKQTYLFLQSWWRRHLQINYSSRFKRVIIPGRRSLLTWTGSVEGNIV